MYERTTRYSCLIAALLGMNFLHTAHAINPVSGWYGGAFLGPSYAPNSDFTFALPRYHSTQPQTGSLSYTVLGNVGGEIGYRFCDRYRLEGEIFYNNSPYSELTFAALTPANQANLLKIFPNITFPNNGIAIQSSTIASGLTMQGQTNTGSFMLNGYYDFLSPSEDNYAKIVPYIGAGIGYVYVQNNISFYYNQTPLNYAQRTHVFQTGAAQGIVGSSYFLDDFTTLSLDFRYFSSAKVSQNGNFGYSTLINRDTFYAINIVFNGSLDAG